MRPLSSSNSGCAPSRSAMRAIALPSASSGMPVSSWKAAKELISGVVSTPPKSEITARMLGGRAVPAPGTAPVASG